MKLSLENKKYKQIIGSEMYIDFKHPCLPAERECWQDGIVVGRDNSKWELTEGLKYNSPETYLSAYCANNCIREMMK